MQLCAVGVEIAAIITCRATFQKGQETARVCKKKRMSDPGYDHRDKQNCCHEGL